MTEPEKLIRQMKRDHAMLLKQFDDAISQCTPGTGTHTRLLEAKAKANERHRAELVKFGVLPENLGAVTKTEFLYVSHVPAVPANRAELEKLLGQQMEKACEGLNYSNEDEGIREQLQSEFK